MSGRTLSHPLSIPDSGNSSSKRYQTDGFTIPLRNHLSHESTGGNLSVKNDADVTSPVNIDDLRARSAGLFSAKSLLIPLPEAKSNYTTDELRRAMIHASSRMKSIAMQHWGSLTGLYSLVQTNPWVNHGRPTIDKSRIPVSIIIGYLTLGPGKDHLQKDYPNLDDATIKEAVDYTLDLLGG